MGDGEKGGEGCGGKLSLVQLQIIRTLEGNPPPLPPSGPSIHTFQLTKIRKLMTRITHKLFNWSITTCSR